MLENYFRKYRENVIGIDQTFQTPFGEKKIVYCDWTASGRLYGPIEDRLKNDIAPYVGNTHTETTITGSSMTKAYHQALKLIKNHVGADSNDVIISSNSGMTGVINKFQRILGLKIHENFRDQISFEYDSKPVVFISHMEHHSNHTSWLETVADVELIAADTEGLVDLMHLEELLNKYQNRKTKIAAVTSYSNVTGIATPYHDIAEVMHRNGGLCFVDFACSAPYVNINMHPDNKLSSLDAIYFSPHKFLGGPGTSGILIFDSKLYDNKVPDDPGGGTVDWTNPWGEHKYVDDIEAREDGGTPAFLQTIKVALCVKLKEEMGEDKMLKREEELLDIVWNKLNAIHNLHVLAENVKERLGIISFYVDNLHYNLAAKILNDRFGIQVRGGCTCAGTYGHYLLHVSKENSKEITDRINLGDLSAKPGWIRFSLHPLMTDDEANFVLDAIIQLCNNHKDWSKDYDYDLKTNEFYYEGFEDSGKILVESWLEKELG